MVTEERLDKIEKDLYRERRRSLWLSGTVIVTWAVLAFSIMTRPQPSGRTSERSMEIRTKRLIIEDDKRKSQLDIRSGGKEGPILALSDNAGRLRFGIQIFQDNPIMNLFGKRGLSGVRIAILNDGPEVLLSDEKGNRTYLVTKGSTRPLQDAPKER